MGERHIPVMLDEVLVALAPKDGESMIDGTFGAGGYSRAILAAGASRVLGIDRDPAALAAGEALAIGGLTLRAGVFGDMEAIAEAAGFAPADGAAFPSRRTGRWTCACRRAGRARPMSSTAAARR